jgi:zinc transport system ATP-binding protein
MTDADTPLLRLEDVWVRLGGQVVLEAVELELDSDAYLALIGPNGGGKSTLLKVILGLLRPERGRVRLWGEPPEAVRHRIGYVPQFASFDPLFPITVSEVVGMGRLYHRRLGRRFTREDQRIIARCLEQVGLSHLAEKQTGSLSGGELQRVLLARALAVQPRLLLLDEPTASVDARAAEEIYALLAELNREIPIIMVSHNMEAISREVRSIACLNRRLHYHGGRELTEEMIHATYGCPVDLIAHGQPHRVLAPHEGPEPPRG